MMHMSNSNRSAEKITMIPLSQIRDFPDHPFRVQNDKAMQQLTESIGKVGVLVPVIVRKLPDGTCQMISGHRRKQACMQLGLTQIPAIVRECDDDTAVITMVDSNLQRETILPSEKARAYKMKLDCIRHQGARRDLTSVRGEQKPGITSREQIAESSPDSASQIQRYIRLNELIPELLNMVDAQTMALTPAVAVSYLTEAEQKMLLLTMESEQVMPSVSQALRLKKLSQDCALTDDAILAVLTEQKKPDCWNLPLPMNRLYEYFPNTSTPKTMQETIFRLLDRWRTVRTISQKRGHI